MKKWWISLWPVLVLSAVFVASGCGGGGGTGGGGGGGGCITDTSDIGDGTGTIIRGVVVDDTGAFVPNLNIQLLRANGSLIRNAATACNGSFAVRVTEVPARFTIQTNTIPNTLYRTYRFGGLWYTPGASNCRTPISITSGVNNNLGTLLMLRRSGPPPPPPTGCTF